MSIKKEKYFNDPRLSMSFSGRLLVRSSTYISYGTLFVAMVLFLAGDVAILRATGAILALFFLDRIRRVNQADRYLTNLPSGKLNVARFLSPSAYFAIEGALDKSLLAGGNFYLHLMKRLVKKAEIERGLLHMDIKAGDLEKKIDSALTGPDTGRSSKEEVLHNIESLVLIACEVSLKSGSHQIETKDILSALAVVEDPAISKIFKFFDVSAEDLRNALIVSRYSALFRSLRRLPSSMVGFMGKPYRSRHRTINRAWTSRPTPFLDQYSQDITDLAKTERVGFLIGHENEYDRLVDVLSRPGRPNVLLVGEPGVGRSTLAAHLAFEISKDRVPAPLFDKRLVQLEIGSLVAGAQEEEVQKRVETVISEIISAGNIVLYIPDIHNLFRTSGQAQMNAADIFIPAIKSDAFSVIGATTPKDSKQYIETNSDFSGMFETIRVQEISESEAAQFLVYESMILEREFRITISFSALKEASALAVRYFHQKPLPGSATDLLKECLADAVQKKKKILAAADIIEVAEKKVNIPIHRAGEEEAEKLLNLEEAIHQRLIDQTEAVSAVSRSLREYRSGLSRKGGPISTFLFVGPTGVGKTELSKILSKIQFGSADAMIRLDMSEYQEKQSISRLIGSNDGGSDGNLTGAVSEKPYSLVLLDEFEKAHPDILNLFLQVFDDGRLTDSAGKLVDFQNTIIIATSNAHSDFIKSELEKGSPVKSISEQIKKKLTDYFKPELLNRFSGVIVFKPLSKEDILAITKIQLKDLAATVQDSNGIDISFSEEAIKEIARLGYDPVFGARPLRGVISEKLRSVLAEKILRKDIKKGDNIKVDLTDNNFILKNV